MPTSKPSFAFPVEPIALISATAALDREARFVAMSDQLRTLARIIRGDHATGLERVLKTLMPTVVTAKLPGQPRAVKQYQPMLEEMGTLCLQQHVDTLNHEQGIARNVLSSVDRPLLYGSYGAARRLSAMTDVRIMPAHQGANVLYRPAYLAAYTGEIIMGSAPEAFICDIAALPSEDMRQTIREYNL